MDWNGSTWVAGGVGENALINSSDGVNWNNGYNNGTGTYTSSVGRVLDNGTWRSKYASLSANVTTDSFGFSVAISNDGNRIAVGAPSYSANTGAVYVYDYSFNADTWNLNASFNGTIIPGDYISNINFTTRFGYSVSMNGAGNRIIAGAPYYTDTATIVTTGTFVDISYNSPTNTWTTTQGNLSGINANNPLRMGSSLAMNGIGNRFLIGAPLYNSGRGLAYDFSLNSSNAFVPSLNTTSLFLYGYTAGTFKYFGTSIAYAANYNRCLVGEPYNGNGLTNNYGFVYSFDLSQNTNYWGLTTVTGSPSALFDQSFCSPNITASDSLFGAAVTVDASGVTAAVGAPNSGTSNSNWGHVYIYKHNGQSWGLCGDISGNAAGENFGSAVALNGLGNRLVVGAPGATVGANASQGRIYVYNIDSTTNLGSSNAVINLAYVLENTTGLTGISQVSDLNGSALAINSYGNRVIGGAPRTAAYGNAYVFDRQMECGALVWNGANWVAGGRGKNPLVYSPDGINWTNNSSLTNASNTLMKTYIGPFGTIRYYAYATAMNAAGTRLAVLAGGDGVSSANNNVTCYVYDMSYNGIWPMSYSWTSGALGYVKYMGQMTKLTDNIPSSNGNINFGSTPLAFDASGSRLAIGVNLGPAGFDTGTGFVNVYSFYNNTFNFEVAFTGAIAAVSIGANNYFGSSVKFNAAGTRLFISSLYQSTTSSATTTGFVNIYNYNPVTKAWPASNLYTKSYKDNNTTLNPSGTGAQTYYSASIAVNSAGNRLVVGAPTNMIGNFTLCGVVYIYQETATGWPASYVRYYTADRASLANTSAWFGGAVTMNSIGDRIAIGEQHQYPSSPVLIFAGRIYIIDYNYTTNAWPGLDGGFGKDVATAYYVENIEWAFLGTVVALNAKGDRLIVTSPRTSAYDASGNFAGTTYIIDYNYATNSWPTTTSLRANGSGMIISGLGVPYILGTKKQYLGNSMAINADGTILAVGSSQAGGFAGVLNLYQYKTKLALTNVNALVSNGTLTVAGGNGATNVMAYSSDNGVTWNNSVSDASGTLVTGYTPGIFYNGLQTSRINSGVGLVSILENPNAAVNEYFGGDFTDVRGGPAVALNVAGTIMVVGAGGSGVGGVNNLGTVYIYRCVLYGPWNLVQTITNPTTAAVASADNFGCSVGLNASGSIMAVGSSLYSSNNGCICIFSANITFTTWTLLQTIINPNYSNTDYFGKILVFNALGNVLVVGAPNYVSETGRAYVFRSNQTFTDWALDASLNNPTGLTGELFANSSAVNVAGTILALGASNTRNGGALYYGRVYMYSYTNGSWVLKTNTPFTSNTDNLGSSVSLNAAGTLLAAGASAAGNSPNYTGFVNIYKYDGTTLSSPTKLFANVAGTILARFGLEVAFDASGEILLIAAPLYSTNNGRTYIYQTTNNWGTAPTPTIIDASGTFFGSNIAINAEGTVFVSGASGYNSNTGRVYTYTYNNPINVLNARQCNALAVNTQKWVAGGLSIANPLGYSLDGQTWLPSVNGTATFPFSGGACNAIKWNGSKWVAGGTGTNALAYSYDGVTWYQTTFTGFTQCNGLTWNGAYWLAAGKGTFTLAYSPDGINWTGIGNSLFSNNFGYAIAGRRVINMTGGGAGGGNQYVTNETFNTLSATVATNLNNALGWNQTWKNVITIRAINVNYYNTTGRPIMVCFSGDNNGAIGALFYVNGITIGRSGGTVAYVHYTGTFIVPPGAYYSISPNSGATVGTFNWMELS